MLWITMPSSLWSSIPRKVVLATLLGMIDSEHEGTTMLSLVNFYQSTGVKTQRT
jgi:dUTPase